MKTLSRAEVVTALVRRALVELEPTSTGRPRLIFCEWCKRPIIVSPRGRVPRWCKQRVRPCYFKALASGARFAAEASPHRSEASFRAARAYETRLPSEHETRAGTRRCTQCWTDRPLEEFRSKRQGGYYVQRCDGCRARYDHWAQKSPEEKLEGRQIRRGLPTPDGERGDDPRVSFTLESGNKKTGKIPVSITSAATCPPSCSFNGSGCYAEFHMVGYWWRQVERRGRDWIAFCRAVRRLPEGQLWRHNEAGDLPGDGERIDALALELLVRSNEGRRGFTFTHKPVLGEAWRENRDLVAQAVAGGFAVNLSADSLEHADELAELGIAPVAVVLPQAERPGTCRPSKAKSLREYAAARRAATATSSRRTSSYTPGGRKIVVCPAETPAALTCLECQLCAVPRRKSIIGFRAHGQMKNTVSDLVQLRRKA